MSFDELLKKEIDESVDRIVSAKIEPLEILKDFGSVEILNLDEMARILRRPEDKVRDAVKRGEIPGNPFGRDIVCPKRLMVDYLLGRWCPQKIEKSEKVINKVSTMKSIARELRNG